jgi:sortase A
VPRRLSAPLYGQRRWVALLWVGRALVMAGLATLALAGYVLFGTNAEQARAQNGLEAALAARVELLPPATPDVPQPTDPDVASSVPTGPEPARYPGLLDPSALPPLNVAPGTALLQLTIPAVDVTQVVVSGAGTAELRVAPGHMPTTPMPGEYGNAAVAGHRTTWGAPFHRLDELVAGDAIFVDAPWGRFQFTVRELVVVSPRDLTVIAPRPGAWLTLITCTPKWSSTSRLVVHAELDGPAPSPTPTPTPRPAPSSPIWEPAAGPAVSPAAGADPVSLLPATAPLTAAWAPGAAAAALWLMAAAVGDRLRSRRLVRSAVRVLLSAPAVALWWTACRTIAENLPPGL